MPTPAPASHLRVVCSIDDATVRDFAPTLARMTVDEAGPEWRVDVDVDPVRGAMVEAARESPGPSTRAQARGRELGEKLVAEFANDLDALSLEGGIRGGVEATLRLRFRGDTSPLVHALTAHPGRAAPATSAFWRLPVDTNLALFTGGAPAADLEGVRAVVFTLFEEATKDDFCADEVAYFNERLRALFFTGGPLVVGVGNDVPGAEKALASFRAQKQGTDATRWKTRQALQTWALVEVDEPASKWADALRDLALIDRTFAKCKPTPPEGGAAKLKAESTETSTQDVVAVPASLRLPAGTLHVVSRSKPTKSAPKDAPPAHSTHFFVVPDAGHTWIAIGDNEAMVVGKVKAALEGAPTSGTLAARAGLESLRADAAGGGFLTPEGLMLLGVDDVTDAHLRDAGATLATLRALPSHGTAPIPFSWQTPPHELAARVLLPAAGVAELMGLAR